MAADLAASHQTTLADIDRDALVRAKSKNSGIEIVQLDVSDHKKLQNAVRDFDMVMCAVPGFLGFETLRSVIEAGKNVVDISFSPENTLELDPLAKENNVTAIVDCGVAPGMDNLLLGYYDQQMILDRFECLVGGLPKTRRWPFFYKAPFSPADVIEEYIRPARYVENGKMVTKEPLSDCEFVEFEKVGTLEAFNTDGLRSILHTMAHIPDMKEKTLRYPGHAEYIKALKKSGFFSREEITIDEQTVSPLRFTAGILKDAWKLEEGEEEMTVMRVTLNGKNRDGETENVVYELYDEYCWDTGISSMARTTGYTATAAANLVLGGLFSEKGLFPPERIGSHEHCFQYIMEYLAERNVRYTKSVTSGD